MEIKELMKVDTTLPEGFDGIFRFTNNSDEDFVARWNSKDYLFPAKTTSPMPAAALNATPLEIQQIRKKFALDWATREFGKGDAYKRYIKQEKNDDGTPRLNSFQQAGSYSTDQLAVLIQMCLLPLKVGEAQVTETKKEPLENKLSRNDDGELNTVAVDKKVSLKKKAIDS